jgi:hypothetical protein
MIDTLSEAIRLGAMLKPQGFDGYANKNTSCALAAAADACGIEPFVHPVDGQHIINYSAIMAKFPVLKTATKCPVSDGRLCGESHVTQSTIWHLNDTHRWTREQIADWVETLEQQQAQTHESPTAVAAQ